MTRGKSGFRAGALATILLIRLVGSAHAQSSSGTPMLKLYVDPKTKQVFTEAGRGRALLANIPVAALDPNAIEQRVEQKTQVQLQQNQQQMLAISKRNNQLESDNAQLARQVAATPPPRPSSLANI